MTIQVHSGFAKDAILFNLKQNNEVKESAALRHDIVLPNKICVDVVDANMVESDRDYNLLLQRRQHQTDDETVYVFVMCRSATKLVRQLCMNLRPTQTFVVVPVVDDDNVVATCINSLLKAKPQQKVELPIVVDATRILLQLSHAVELDLLGFVKTNHLSIADLFDKKVLEKCGMCAEDIDSLTKVLSTDRFLL
ncbi:hypothetical protein EIN_150920 [Entamoeba invadens IP1]|uniref:Uncharacterized protein n=1 Tax=Entamoeba invadens IP1 TaxID=370355 RepID=A0A0A1U8E8_ENTIV|nr:hypothetical protein EIN_150920 [Entamoeba invadens IP1]ELP91215.1 hypothetical protein EIN_150920 [Entamoeba invadens IP1]|eukprot:XP_004257986.1 hypothetical protein EIN_150920 [Entamoeba invadens IP1]